MQPKAGNVWLTSAVCYQTKLILGSRGGLVGVDTRLMEVKVAFAVLVCVAYVGYFGVSVWNIGRKEEGET